MQVSQTQASSEPSPVLIITASSYNRFGHGELSCPVTLPHPQGFFEPSDKRGAEPSRSSSGSTHARIILTSVPVVTVVYYPSQSMERQQSSNKISSNLFAHACEIYGYLLIIQRPEFSQKETVCCHGNNNSNNVIK